MDATSLIPLNPRDYLVLFSLTAGERHGYGIVRDIEAQSAGRVRVDPANLYRSIKRMITSGLVEEADGRRSEGEGEEKAERRRNYRITAFGLEVLKLEAERLADLTKAARYRQLLPETEATG